MSGELASSPAASSGGRYAVPALREEDVPGGACCVAESTFATLFPGYMEKYVTEAWPAVEAVLQQHKLKGKLDAVEGSMSVTTTKNTWDPYAIMKARDFLKLIARNVPVSQAQKIFETEITSEIIKIGMKAKSTKRFVRRRDRLIGPAGQTLKALEILTGCYVLVQGKTVAVMGPHRGCQDVRKIVEDCMRNIHPIYGLRRLLIKRELMKREDMKHEDWSRFLPVYKKATPNREKQKAFEKKKKDRLRESLAKSAKKEKSIFPPAPPKRKEDIAMETGEAFLGNRAAALAGRRRTGKRERDDFQLAE